MQPAAVEQTRMGQAGHCIARCFVRGKQAYGQRAPNTVGHVHSHSAYRVVNMQFLIQQLHNQHHQNTGHSADDPGAQSVRYITGGSHSHQSGQRAVQGHGHIRLAVLDPSKDHGGASGHSRRYGGGHQDRRQSGYIGSRRAVKAVPGKPQDKHAQRAQSQGVTGNGFGCLFAGFFVRMVLTDPGTEKDGADQRRNTAHHVNGAGSGVVVEAQLLQPAVAVHIPDPARLDGIHHSGDHC